MGRLILRDSCEICYFLRFIKKVYWYVRKLILPFLYKIQSAYVILNLPFLLVLLFIHSKRVAL